MKGRAQRRAGAGVRPPSGGLRSEGMSSQGLEEADLQLRSDYVRGRISLDEFERRLEARLLIREGLASAWPRLCDQIGHVFALGSPGCVVCWEPYCGAYTWKRYATR